MPAPHKRRLPGVDDAIAAAKQANERLKAHDVERQARFNERAQFISQAVELGATWSEMAREFEVSVSRVRQMAIPLEPK